MNRNQLVRIVQVLIAEDNDMREPLNGSLQICESSFESRAKLVVWNIMSTLANSHGDPFARLVNTFDTDENEHNGVSERCVGCELIYFLADRIRQHCFKDEALSLVYQFPTDRCR
jgi:hypothetical protein